MVSPVDSYLAKLPGSVPAKAAAAGFLLTAALAYPVFRVSREGRQGHDYLSSERPEAISAGQDRLRRENRKRLGLALDRENDQKKQE